MCQFHEVERSRSCIVSTGRTSTIYGWRYDHWAINDDGTIGAIADLPEIDNPQIAHYEVNPSQYDILTDDVTPHLLIIGSRGSGKTKLAELWHIKQICRWSGKAIGMMREKRIKLRLYVEQRLLPNLPTHWIPHARSVRKAQDELAIHVANNVWLWFVTSFLRDDARGDDIVAALIDETQLTPAEARENLILSCRKVVEKNGQKKQLQTLETGTYVDGEFLDYVDRARASERYRVIELSITDNIHLETAYDDVVQYDIPEQVITARTIMDPRRFHQEIGIWDSERKRFCPTVQTMSKRIYWSFRRDRHVHKFPHRRHEAVQLAVQRLFDTTRHNVGEDITADVAHRRGYRRGCRYVGGCDLEIPPLSAVIGRIFSTPPGVPDLLWIVDEITVDEDATRLGQAICAAGYGNVAMVPDAVGWISRAGRVAIRELRSELGRERVYGPAQNPDDKDRINTVNAKLLNANKEITIAVDPKCIGLITALQKQMRTPNQKRDPEMENYEHHLARALGYLVHKFWPVE